MLSLARIVESHPTICVYWGLLFVAGSQNEVRDGAPGWPCMLSELKPVSGRWEPRKEPWA